MLADKEKDHDQTKAKAKTKSQTMTRPIQRLRQDKDADLDEVSSFRVIASNLMILKLTLLKLLTLLATRGGLILNLLLGKSYNYS